ncbi:MAG TPA: methylmalonyl-CoA mutase [Planctomycetes bacterium]|nr:methylmalonyl-CoA mutase [Planctomycetota bacterium]
MTPSPKGLRFITAASLFDGHDAAINIMRRILQQEGTEVIHLGHNRSVEEIAEAAVQEDVHGIAISSYQGGHMEFFKYLVAKLEELGRPEIPVFGGGGGTITDDEITELHAAGVNRIYSVEDGRILGLAGMIKDMMERANRVLSKPKDAIPPKLFQADPAAIARGLTLFETLHSQSDSSRLEELRAELYKQAQETLCPILGITGTGGAGKSSLTDEWVLRFRERFPERAVGILSIDPTRRKTGGALLGDRIRMNAVRGPRCFMRSMATRRAHSSTAKSVEDGILILQAAGFDLVILETAGIGQSDSEAADLCDISLYVMTPEYGAPSQLEKIDMLDFADGVAINKSDKRGAQDALRDVRKQVQRNRQQHTAEPESMPVFLTKASRFADPGIDNLFVWTCTRLEEVTDQKWEPGLQATELSSAPIVVPPERTRYLSEIAEAIREFKRAAKEESERASRADGLSRTLSEFGDIPPPPNENFPAEDLVDKEIAPEILVLRQRYQEVLTSLNPKSRSMLADWREKKARYTENEFAYTIRGKEIRTASSTATLSGTRIPKVALPATEDWGYLSLWTALENVPGEFPFTAGVFPIKRTEEDPTRMFAGEGTPEQTNRRFHYVSKGQPAVRLSTAFDSVTLYGEDPDMRPDIYGKVGNSGVSICTLDDMKRLYSGFDLSDPKTSVSMTINGPAPMILAFFLNAAIDQAVEKRLRETGRWESAEQKIVELTGNKQPVYRAELPDGHNGMGLGLLGVTGEQILDSEEYAEIREQVLKNVRGTVQADILKEDQAQNTCIFNTDFALKLMGDMQQFFVDHHIQNFYSVSVSGYHIAEAGANPISQLAFTLANGFTFVEYYRARGMDVEDFARNLSFFFSNGVDAEYSVIGRVARRIWAIAMRDIYGANERAQKLKYHIQTSGRSLHAQEISFNDIRTTLQALYAINDNCNSLHTNAYDEAITTPTEESVRRALAIQLIINRELGLTANENPLQGAFIINELTDLVEEAVLEEFLRLDERGGVLGAMETMYQRSRIQEESLVYETQKHSGELPVVGVNTFLNPRAEVGAVVEKEMIRAGTEEKDAQVNQVKDSHEAKAAEGEVALKRLKNAALQNEDTFTALIEAAKVCTLGQMSSTLYGVGGKYRRSM